MIMFEDIIKEILPKNEKEFTKEKNPKPEWPALSKNVKVNNNKGEKNGRSKNY